MNKYSFTVTNPDGLFATPVNALVNTAGKFASEIQLTYNSRTVNLKSMMGVISLAIPTKADVEIGVEGPDEDDALKALKETIVEQEIAVLD